MAEPRNKVDKEAGKLSETTKTFVNEWIIEQIYGVKKDISSKYIDKGNLMEEEAIKELGNYHRDFYLKNTDHFDNGYMTGTPDIITENKILDVKCSWDCFTFPLLETDLPNKDYYWQMQGYMQLASKEHAEVIYCLMNTPLELAYNELDQKDYTEFAYDKRFKSFQVDYNMEYVDKLYDRVDQIRNYIKSL